MKLLTASLVAATLMAPLAATSASACNVVAAHVTGNHNFVDLDVSGCGYTSAYLRGSYSFAQIVNILGAVVTGIYGNGNYYDVRNVGDNELGIYVDGAWHSTRVDIRGNGSSLDLQQRGARSDVDVTILGDNNPVRIHTH